MGFNLYFDYAALLIFSFLILSAILKKQHIGTSNKLYLLVVLISLGATVLDIVASMDYLDRMVLIVLNTFFFLTRAGIALSLFFYAANLGRIFHRMKKKPWAFLISLIPYAILIGCLIANFFNQMIFDYLPTNPYTYQRGPFAWIAYTVSYLYVAAAIVLMILSRRYHLKSQVIAVCIAFLVQVSASIFQFFVVHVLVEMLITSVTLMTLSIFIENPENFVDSKTGSLNFRSFTSDLKHHYELDEPCAVALVHIQNFSSLYNLYTHDEALRYIRSVVASFGLRVKALDKTSQHYYLGDATFAILFNNRKANARLLHLLNEAFERPISANGISFRLLAKTCLVLCPEDCPDVESMMAFSSSYFELTEEPNLDLAPYRLAGGNVLFELDRILEHAIRERSFSLHYQPIYSIEEKKYVSAEALLRLEDPKFGMIMPSLIIPYAENCGKIAEIGAIVLEKAFTFYDEKLRGKIEYLEVNLSPLQLLDPDLAIHIFKMAEKHGVKPNEVIFEITESAAIMENPTVQDNIKALIVAGYRIAIDDFGTGYSNLSRLTKLDIYVLKFDRSMTLLLEDEGQDEFFLGLFRLFQSKGMQVLFEGVETEELARKLRTMGADQIQGFYFAKAHPEEEFLAILEGPVKEA